VTWTPFSAEAIVLDSQCRRLHAEGRITDAIAAIEEALERAHRDGPSNISHDEFEAAATKGKALNLGHTISTNPPK
jgi:hypothetical protein